MIPIRRRQPGGWQTSIRRSSSGSPAIDSPPDPVFVERFRRDLGALWRGEGRLGLAVSGGPDSVAMLLLAHAALPGRIEAATVDHGLRPEGASEASMVADVCTGLEVPHSTLTVEVAPGNLQKQARLARYSALKHWASDRKLDAVLTAHHADDQAETLLMRLNRGSGVAGLAGIRASTKFPGSDAVLLRPLLGWRREELRAVVDAAGVMAADDPSNANPEFDRVRMRRALARADWLDPLALAQSAAHLAEAEDALTLWTEREWAGRVRRVGRSMVYRPQAPRIIRLRIVQRIIEQFGGTVRGSAAATLLDHLEAGEGGNLGGVLARPVGDSWRFEPEPIRKTG